MLKESLVVLFYASWVFAMGLCWGAGAPLGAFLALIIGACLSILWSIYDAKAKKKELAEYISCFKGYISDEELAVWLHKSNIHLSTCTPLELFALKRHKFLELYVKTTEKYKLYETIFSNVNDKTQQ